MYLSIYCGVLYFMSCKPILNMGKVVKCNNLCHFSLELCVSGVIFHRYFTQSGSEVACHVLD